MHVVHKSMATMGMHKTTNTTEARLCGPVETIHSYLWGVVVVHRYNPRKQRRQRKKKRLGKGEVKKHFQTMCLCEWLIDKRIFYLSASCLVLKLTWLFSVHLNYMNTPIDKTFEQQLSKLNWWLSYPNTNLICIYIEHVCQRIWR